MTGAGQVHEADLRLSVVTVMRGELEQLEEMLPTVAWAAEVHLVETGPDVEATRQAAGDRAVVHAHPLPRGAAFDAARAVAFAHVPTQWVLVVDTDERVTPELRRSIEEGLPGWAAADVSGVHLPRRNHVLGHRMTAPHYWPQYQLRLYRKDRVLLTDTLHDYVSVQGTTLHLPAQERFALQHHPFRSTQQWLDKINIYSTIEAAQRPSPTATPGRALVAAGRSFLGSYVKRRGLVDGRAGLHHCVLLAVYRYLDESKRWEAAGAPDPRRRR